MDGSVGVLDIREKEVSAPQPPSFATVTSTATGQPHLKVRSRVSAFKQQRLAKFRVSANQPETPTKASIAAANVPAPASTHKDGTRKANVDLEERVAIDRENTEKLNSMSHDEIEVAREELFKSLDPSLIQILLRRANLDDGNKSSLPEPQPPRNNTENSMERVEDSVRKESDVTAGRMDESAGKLKEESGSSRGASANPRPKKTVTFEDAAPDLSPDDTIPAAQLGEKTMDDVESLATNTTHFPHPPAIPDLDINDPDFLENLHQKYFPSLPADPSKLAWMAPIPTPHSTADRDSPYYPGKHSLAVSQLRFDFRGKLIPPRLSRKIPVTKGLHHHGEAPEAAGYTIPELGRLARSAVPAQRCIAFQTLGRMLYRLGYGEWGVGEGGRMGDEDDLAFGLWRCFQENRVLDSLGESASVEEGVGHQSCRAYAIEALWLFEKGGWKEKWRGM